MGQTPGAELVRLIPVECGYLLSGFTTDLVSRPEAAYPDLRDDKAIRTHTA